MCETKELCRTQQCGDDDHAAATASCEGCLKAGRVLLIFSSAPLDLPSPPEHHCSPSLKNDMKPLTLLLGFTALLHSLTGAASVDSRIINGHEVTPHSKPYMASLQIKRSHICGGFLVGKSFVMTAAHCFNRGAEMTVVLGAHDIINRAERTQRIAVRFYHIYPGYDNTTLQNDIMLLQLQKEAQLGSRIQCIPLPKKDKDVKPNTECIVAGWGATTTGGEASSRLRAVNVTVVDRKVCKTAWRGQITPRMMCAGGNVGKRGFCQGDSGGPLVCNSKKPTAEGIVSFNELKACDNPQIPNVYTQVSKYLPWIKCIMGSTN
ncbi:transmembrane protease serine 9-like [Acipenser oxyrinchus oxyrinchus]|uniref:Transmembrane protease serine 9-like n=1 Tax=Acipenser oxyrinchus oxyrinchus TaxID=40147 RepID=A0AAD8CL69_ACIOX|nr:transmembrane protease serine 9-like [Acipenser oxyrinchus oxyrinchus]